VDFSNFGWNGDRRDVKIVVTPHLCEVFFFLKNHCGFMFKYSFFRWLLFLLEVISFTASRGK
jgi:hypothetical protein